MAESGATSGMKIIIKTPKDKKEIILKEGGTLDELKQMVADSFNCKVNQLCLIFAGKILRDGDTLEQHTIKDGHTLHLVIKTPKTDAPASSTAPTPTPAATTAGSTPASNPTPNVAQSPFGLGGLGGMAGLGEMGMGGSNFMEMQQRMSREMLSNPEMLSSMMNNPMVQSLMSNPDVMRQLVTSNPQMRDLMERNPEITHMLNNPELMRQTMELARNPSMMQELMRSQDRAMSNLESIPGGFNALTRMYRDVQEPMMDAAQEGFGNNPFAALSGQNNSSNTTNTQQGRENTEPLPNPWAAPTRTTSSSGGSTTQSQTTTAGMPTGMFNNPGMQSMMGQLQQDPQMMQNLMQTPYMQQMLQSMSANPDMANSMIGANPMFAGNPQMQEYMRTMMPTFLNQMQNPEMQNLLSNPRAMEAMMQIQRGMQQLQQEAPSLASTMGIPGVPGIPNPVNVAPNTTSSTNTTNSSTTTTSTAGGTTPAAAAAQPEQFQQFMAQMVNMMGQTNVGDQQNQQAPEQRFAAQLDQMAAMGFVDRPANIQALTATFGDVNAAIDRLLQQR